MHAHHLLYCAFSRAPSFTPSRAHIQERLRHGRLPRHRARIPRSSFKRGGALEDCAGGWCGSPSWRGCPSVVGQKGRANGGALHRPPAQSSSAPPAPWARPQPRPGPVHGAALWPRPYAGPRHDGAAAPPPAQSSSVLLASWARPRPQPGTPATLTPHAPRTTCCVRMSRCARGLRGRPSGAARRRGAVPHAAWAKGPRRGGGPCRRPRNPRARHPLLEVRPEIGCARLRAPARQRRLLNSLNETVATLPQRGQRDPQQKHHRKT